MNLADKAKIFAVAATLVGTTVGVALANRLQPRAITQDYWQRVISGEKQKRISLLDEVGKFGADGSWTADDVKEAAVRLYAARIFQFWGWGDSAYIVHVLGDPVPIPGDDTGPGEGIGHFMTWRYDQAFRPYDGLLEKLAQLHEKLKPREIPKDKLPSEQRVADLRLLSGYRQLTPPEQEEISSVDYKPPMQLDLRTTNLGEQVRNAAEEMKRVLRDPHHQREDYRLVRREVITTSAGYYGIFGLMSMLISAGGAAFVADRKGRRSPGTGIEKPGIDQQIEMQPDAPLHTNYEQLKLPF